MAEPQMYGGQAVIEGVMMRGPRFIAIACRRPDGGITVQQEAIANTLLGRLKWLDRPLLRGTLAIMDAMVLGMRSLSFSASVQTAQPAATDGDPAKPTRLADAAVGVTMVVSFAMALGLFVALPTLATQLIQTRLGIEHSIARNAVDGLIRLAIFLAYITVISRMDGIRRVFQYHGAEHKAINTLEAGLPPTVGNSALASRIHPRCGTSFVIIVLVTSILVHCIFPRPENALKRVALHLGLVPIVAGVAYEVTRFAGRRRNDRMLRVMLAPGLWTQRLTTREPDASQIEVALAALNTAIALETGERSVTDLDASPAVA